MATDPKAVPPFPVTPFPSAGVIMISGDNRSATITRFLKENRHLVPIYEEYSYSTSTDSTEPDTIDALVALRSPDSKTPTPSHL